MANDVSGMDVRCAALILAAGRGTRFGGGKMLADIDGKPMLQHVLDLAADAGFEPVVVVLGDDADEIERRIQWREERRVRNPDPGRGLSSSLALGIEALGEHQRVLMLLGDQPYLTIDQISAITTAPRNPARPIVVPRYADGNSGNPVLLEREAFALAADLEGDRGMSQLFSSRPDLVRHVGVAGNNPDIDTPAQLEAVHSRVIVSAGYDALGDRYDAWRSRVSDPLRDRHLADFFDRVKRGSPVLELGCGSGSSATAQLARAFDLTGVDISPVQIAAARLNVPRGRFILSDMTTIDLPAASFEGAVALYSLIHLPRQEQPALLRKVHGWLRPGGLFLATFSAEGGTDWTGEWLGVPMFFSGFNAARNREMLSAAGFELLIDEEADLIEPEGPARFQWILATAIPA